MSRYYYTYTRMPGYQKDPGGYDKPIWCVATQFEESPPQCLPGGDMKNLMFEDAKRKAEELEAKADEG